MPCRNIATQVLCRHDSWPICTERLVRRLLFSVAFELLYGNCMFAVAPVLFTLMGELDLKLLQVLLLRTSSDNVAGNIRDEDAGDGENLELNLRAGLNGTDIRARADIRAGRRL